MRWFQRTWVQIIGALAVLFVAGSVYAVYNCEKDPTSCEEPDDGAPAEPEPKPPAPKPPAESFLWVSDWNNRADEDLKMCVKAYGPTWESDPVCWGASGRSDMSGWAPPIEVGCRADMTRLFVGLFDVDGNAVNGEEQFGNFCTGEGHGYSLTVTASYLIDWKMDY